MCARWHSSAEEIRSQFVLVLESCTTILMACLIIGASCSAAFMIRVLDVRIKHLENFPPLFMTDIVVDKKDCVPLWASFWRDLKNTPYLHPPPPQQSKKKKNQGAPFVWCTLCLVHPLFGLCCEVPSTVEKTEIKIKVQPLSSLCCEVPSTVKRKEKKNQGVGEVPSIVKRKEKKNQGAAFVWSLLWGPLNSK